MSLQEEKHVTSRLVRAQEAIRKKYKLMKQGRLQAQLDATVALEPLTKLFKPSQPMPSPPPPPPANSSSIRPRFPVKRKRLIIRHKPLTILHKVKQEDKEADKYKIKQEEADKKEDELMDDYTQTENEEEEESFTSNSDQNIAAASTPLLVTPRRGSLESKTPLEKVASTPEGEDKMEQYLRQFHLFVRPFLRALITGNKSNLELDKTYGPKVNPNGTLSLGNQKLTLDRDYIYLSDKVKVPITEGLLNLLFLRQPTEYTPLDKANYRDLLWFSNVVHQGYSKFRPYNTTGLKYRTLLKAILGPAPTTAGKGFVKAVNAYPRYVFFDDPNEIVDRLRLLMASKQAGNTAHDPEINSILEELKELNIIL